MLCIQNNQLPYLASLFKTTLSLISWRVAVSIRLGGLMMQYSEKD